MTFRLDVASVLQILTGTFNMLQVLDSNFKNIFFSIMMLNVLMNFVRSDFSILANRYGISLLPSKPVN